MSTPLPHAPQIIQGGMGVGVSSWRLARRVADYVRKGGKAENTVGGACLCNGLMANIGLAQTQKWGREERLFTAGDDLVHLPLGSPERPRYSAADVLAYLHGEQHAVPA